MPVNKLSNNRILPNNAQAVDVARRAIDTILPVQNRRYDAAFKVNGYSGILYAPIKSGPRCSCMSTPSSDGLMPDGKARPGDISELLTSHGFSIEPYATKQTDAPAYEILDTSPSFFGVVHQNTDRQYTSTNTGARKIDLDKGTPLRIQGSPFDLTGTDASDPTVSTVVGASTFSNAASSNAAGIAEIPPNIQEKTRLSDSVFNGTRSPDASCPICFGSGVIGGWTILNGWRKVLVPFSEDAVHDGEVIPALGGYPITKVHSYIEWTLSLPKNQVALDEFRVFSGIEIIRPARILLDGDLVVHPQLLLGKFDGNRHKLRIEFDTQTTLSHVELQVNQSTSTVNFEFPKISKSGQPDVIDSTQPVQIILSPLVPAVSVGNIIVESTSGRAYIVTDVTDWKTRRAHTMGWEVTARVAQPQELVNLLPRRKSVSRNTTPALVRKNFNGR